MSKFCLHSLRNALAAGGRTYFVTLLRTQRAKALKTMRCSLGPASGFEAGPPIFALGSAVARADLDRAHLTYAPAQPLTA